MEKISFKQSTTTADCMLDALTNSSFIDYIFSLTKAQNSALLSDLELNKIYSFLETENYPKEKLAQLFEATGDLFNSKYSLSELLIAKCLSTCSTDVVIETMTNNPNLGFSDLLMLLSMSGGVAKKSVVSKELRYEDNEYLTSVFYKVLKEGVVDKFRLCTLQDFLKVLRDDLSFDLASVAAIDSLKDFNSVVLRGKLNVDSYLRAYALMRITGATKEDAFLHILDCLHSGSILFTQRENCPIWYSDYYGLSGFISIVDLYEVLQHYNGAPWILENGHAVMPYSINVSDEDKELILARRYYSHELSSVPQKCIIPYCGNVDGIGKTRRSDKSEVPIYFRDSESDIPTFSYWLRCKLSGANLRLIKQRDINGKLVNRLIIENRGFMARSLTGLDGTATIQYHSVDSRLFNITHNRNFEIKCK